MKTTHQYVHQYPILSTSRKLILGTIHPHDVTSFKIPFFYGSRLSIWNILNEAFDKELGDQITLDGVLNFLKVRNIAISDTILSCSRKTPSALDGDLIPEILNFALLEQIRNSKIDEIFFTSGLAKNNAFKLFFVDILKQKITADIKDNKSFLLNISFFGRPIKLTILLSPSGSANGSISKSKEYLQQKDYYQQFCKPVKQFRIDFYKKKFMSEV